MPTEKYFACVPPFPSDVPVASIPKISLSQLQANDPVSSSRLFSAFRRHGFVHLDLSHSGAGEELLRDAEQTWDLMTSTFDLGREELKKYPSDMPRDLLRYKEPGNLKCDDGNMDSMEVYSIGQDDMLGVPGARLENPITLEQNRRMLQSFLARVNRVVSVVLAHLNAHLGLEPGTLEGLSSLDAPSGSMLRFLRNRPQPKVNLDRVTLGGHTDLGIIALLFHVTGGLQIRYVHLVHEPVHPLSLPPTSFIRFTNCTAVSKIPFPHSSHHNTTGFLTTLSPPSKCLANPPP